jgi:hypothetical protein
MGFSGPTGDHEREKGITKRRQPDARRSFSFSCPLADGAAVDITGTLLMSGVVRYRGLGFGNRLVNGG